MNFAYAEALESNKSFTEVHGIFETFLGVLKKELNDLTLEGRASSGNEANYFNPMRQGIEVVNDEAELPLPDFNYGSTRNQDLSSRQTAYGVSWIAYMRFARRAESLEAARAVFGKARKDPWTPWEVYEAAGMSSQAHTLDIVYRDKATYILSPHGVPLHQGHRHRRSHLRKSFREVLQGGQVHTALP